MKGIVTFDKDGKECITRFDFCLSNNESEVIKTLHLNDVMEQQGKWLKENINLEKSNFFVGYQLSTIPNFKSRLSNIKFRYGKEWERKLYESMIST